MQKHLDQVAHNIQFHTALCQNFPGQYHDWKITTLFYTALHYLKALAKSKNINIGETHYDIEANCNPRRHNASMRLSEKVWEEYKCLFNYSQTARYAGVRDKTFFEQLMAEDYKYCLKHLEYMRKYVQGKMSSTDKSTDR